MPMFGFRAKWIRDHLYPTIMRSQSNNTKIVGFEDETDYLASFGTYMKLFHKDVWSKIDIIGIHWYLDFLIPRSITLEYAHFLFPDKSIMMTESAPGM